MKRSNDTIKAMGQRRNLSRRKSLRTKNVKNEEINRTDRAKGKVTGNKGSEMRWRTGGIFEVAESHAERATSPQHSLGAKVTQREGVSGEEGSTTCLGFPRPALYTSQDSLITVGSHWKIL